MSTHDPWYRVARDREKAGGGRAGVFRIATTYEYARCWRERSGLTSDNRRQKQILRMQLQKSNHQQGQRGHKPHEFGAKVTNIVTAHKSVLTIGQKPSSAIPISFINNSLLELQVYTFLCLNAGTERMFDVDHLSHSISNFTKCIRCAAPSNDYMLHGRAIF